MGQECVRTDWCRFPNKSPASRVLASSDVSTPQAQIVSQAKGPLEKSEHLPHVNVCHWRELMAACLFPQKLVDGVLSNSLPILPVGRTVTISILSGRSDISPQDKGQRNRLLTITNQEVMVSD